MDQKITALEGYSGCDIFLFEDDNGKQFVRKYSSNKEYNTRLYNQMQKQKEFQNNILKVPIIYGSGYSNGIFYFDMEYIQGITLAEYIKTIDVSQIYSIVNSIVSGIKNQSFKEYSKCNEQNYFFRKKFENLYSRLYGKRYYIDIALDYLKNKNWDNFKTSFCHGDLTFENIIINGNQLYLIDFLDSFYDSWLLDMSTLLQDSQCMWSYRNQKSINVNTRLRLMIFKNLLLKQLSENGYEIIVDIYHALLLKLIRIYPYTQEKQTLLFLDDSIDKVLKFLHSMEEQKWEH